MERRRSERTNVQIDITIRIESKSCSGFIDNVSEEGLAITIITAPEECINGFSSGSKLGLTFTAKGKEISLQCEIKWVSKSAEIHVGLIYIMGAVIIDPPAEYKEFIKTL